MAANVEPSCESPRKSLDLPLIDLASPDRPAVAGTIRQACIDYGFFYLINHGIKKSVLLQVFEESKKFFDLPLHEKMKLERNSAHRGYTPMHSELLDLSQESKGDPKESFYIGPLEENDPQNDLNQWPSEENLPYWRTTMKSYYQDIMNVGKMLLSLIALALNLDDQFFVKIGALEHPMPFLRLLHYPGDLNVSDAGKCGASAHSDYGMITLLATNGVPGLQICRDKDKNPRLWEDVHHVDGAFIVNVGDMLERWTNCLFRSTFHRVIVTGQERFSAAFFFDPTSDCLVQCLESCCSEENPPRFLPIRSGDYLREKLRATYGFQDVDEQ